MIVEQRRFRIGQRVRVRYHAVRFMRADKRDPFQESEFEVMRALPRESAAFQYHVRNLKTDQQILIDERDLYA